MKFVFWMNCNLSMPNTIHLKIFLNSLRYNLLDIFDQLWSSVLEKEEMNEWPYTPTVKKLHGKSKKSQLNIIS